MLTPDQKIDEMGITLHAVTSPPANFVPVVISGSLAFVSGQGPLSDGAVVWKGSVGHDITPEEGYQAARLAAINALSVLKNELGSLNRIKRFVKLLAWVRSAPGFDQQHLVINGASDFIVEVFGDKGKHARSAVSATELPLGMAVEIEMIAEIVAE